MTEPDGNWRDTVPQTDRVRVSEHILSKLSTYYSTLPQASLREQSSEIESLVYSQATSRRDYLEKLAEFLSKAERATTRERTASNCAPYGNM